MISAKRPEWALVLTGLSVRQFRKLVQIAVGRGGEQTGTSRRWGLSLVKVIRYRYRGSNIPTPWTPRPAVASIGG